MNEQYLVCKIEDNEEYVSLQLQDKRYVNFKFWIDLDLDLEDFYNFEFNQYIFREDNEYDIFLREYQKDDKNIDEIIVFLENNIDEIKKLFKGE